MAERLSNEIREFVARRARGCCEYCRIARWPGSVDHILPRSRGGSDDPGNLAWACVKCNLHKWKKTEAPDPIDGRPAPLFDPRRQVWRGHFTWNHDWTLILGLTPTGRATVAALRMNQGERIRQREILFVAGLHPPPEPEG